MRGSTHAGQMDMTTQDGPPRARGDRPVVSQPGGATFKATPARAGINRTEMAYNEKTAWARPAHAGVNPSRQRAWEIGSRPPLARRDQPLAQRPSEPDPRATPRTRG